MAAVRRGSPGRLALDFASAGRGHLPSSWGVGPGGLHAASGGALRDRCGDEHRYVRVAGVDPASWKIRRPRSCQVDSHRVQDRVADGRGQRQ